MNGLTFVDMPTTYAKLRDACNLSDTSHVENERGSYGGHGDLGTTLVVGFGILGVIFVLSPGARHWYKHGYLPPASPEESSQWPRR